MHGYGGLGSQHTSCGDTVQPITASKPGLLAEFLLTFNLRPGRQLPESQRRKPGVYLAGAFAVEGVTFSNGKP